MAGVLIVEPGSGRTADKKCVPMVTARKWIPIYIQWDWNEGPGTPQISSLVIVLPSGVQNSKAQFSFQVNCNSRGLSITGDWPKELTICEKVHSWLGENDNKSYRSCLIGFKMVLAKWQSFSMDTIEMHCVIPLSFKVLKKIKMIQRCWWKNSSTSVVYIDLKEDERSDYIQDNDDTVVILD